jgi:hypothetical protein
MRADAIRGEGLDERCSAVPINLGGAGEPAPARWIRPQRVCESLHEVTDPPDSERLASLDTRGRQ